MSTILETERLFVRQLTLEDKAFIIALLNSPGWLKFIGDRNVRTEEQAMHYLKSGPLRSYELHGFGLWLVALKSDESPIGMCGLLKRETLDVPDLGFAFLPEHGGRGYAQESVRAVLDFAMDKFALGEVAAVTLPDNSRSVSLLEHLGFAFQKRIQLSPGAEELLLFNKFNTLR